MRNREAMILVGTVELRISRISVMWTAISSALIRDPFKSTRLPFGLAVWTLVGVPRFAKSLPWGTRTSKKFRSGVDPFPKFGRVKAISVHVTNYVSKPAIFVQSCPCFG